MGQLDLLQGTIKAVRVRSQLTPSFRYDPWAPSEGPPAEGESWLMSIVKPEIVVETAAGDVPLAPWGRPERDYSLVALVALGLVVVGAVTAIGWVARKM